MAVNIGPKIGIDGEKEYRKSINDLITQQKTFSAEMKELESTFDENTSAMEKNRKKGELLGKQIENQAKQVEELEKGLEASKEKYGENTSQTNKWKQAVSNAKTELNKMQKELDKIPKSLSQVGQGMQKAGQKMQSVGASLTKYVTAPLVALGAASVAAWKEVDEGMDIVAKKTGATGQELIALQESASNIATTLPTSFETAGTAIGEVNTKFGLTGQSLESLTGTFIKFAEITDQDVNSAIDGTQKVMAAFGVDTADADKVLDAMAKTGQKTGVSMDTLQTSMVKNAAALQNMGMDAYQAAGFLGSVEQSGADTSVVMSGLQKALVNAADDGKTLPQALSEFQGVMNSTATDQEKLTAAVDLFGKKAGPAIYEACKQGSLSFESLSTDAQEYLGTVEQTFNDVKDPADEFQIALNKVKDAGSEIGGALLKIAAPAIEEIGDKAKKAGEWFSSLDEDQQRAAINIAGAFALTGPAVTAIGKFTEKVGEAVTKVGNLVDGSTKLSGWATAGGYVTLAAAAIGTVAGAITLYEESVKSNSETVQDITERTNSATKDLDESIKTLRTDADASKKAIDEIDAQANLANNLINRLAELESQSSKTAAEQQEMQGIVSELNSMYPDLRLEIDETTGSLNKGTSEIQKYVENARKMSLLKAYSKAVETSYEDLARAQVNLTKAEQASKENKEDIIRLENELKEARAEGNLEAAALGDSTGAESYAVGQLRIELEAAKQKQGELNQSVQDAQTAVDEVNGTVTVYEQSMQDLEAELDGTTEAQGENKTATDEAAQSVSDLGTATEEATEEVKDYQAAISDSVGAISDMGRTLADTAVQAAKAWNDQYQSAYDSISGQLGLFDEWEQNTEATAQSILKNLESQITGMQNYNDNMAKLTKAAVESNDPNFKAFVQAVSEMGVGAAGEVQALVTAMETDQTTFNEIVQGFDTMGTLKEEYAANTTYIANDFQTKGQMIQSAWQGALKKIGQSDSFKKLKEAAITTAASVKKEGDGIAANSNTNSQKMTTSWGAAYLNMYNTAKTTTANTVSETQTNINGMRLEPKLTKIGVPAEVTNEAKQKANAALDRLNGRLEKITNAAAAGKTAASTASAEMQDINGKMTITNATEAAERARSAIQSLFNNNPITSIIRTVTQNAGHNAKGGIIQNETVSFLAEGDKAEAVIPLEAHRSRALSLYQETGRILGVAPSFTVGRETTVSAPRPNVVDLSFNEDKLYATVAAAAARGMESADVRVYVNGREAGRIMRDMGVQFA